jgi:hypothetical protein
MIPIAATVVTANASTITSGAWSCSLRSAAWISYARASMFRLRPPRRSAALTWPTVKPAPMAGFGALASTETQSLLARSSNATNAAG